MTTKEDLEKLLLKNFSQEVTDEILGKIETMFKADKNAAEVEGEIATYIINQFMKDLTETVMEFQRLQPPRFNRIGSAGAPKGKK